MSINHEFMMNTGHTIDEVIQLLTEKLPFFEYVTSDEELAQRSGKWKTICTTDRVTNFSIMDGSIHRDDVKEVFGFSPDISFFFEMNKSKEHYEKSELELLQTSIFMLQHFSGDAALFLSCTERTALHRKNGTIYLSTIERKRGNWRDIDLENFTLPYEWADLPYLYD